MVESSIGTLLCNKKGYTINTCGNMDTSPSSSKGICTIYVFHMDTILKDANYSIVTEGKSVFFVARGRAGRPGGGKRRKRKPLMVLGIKSALTVMRAE